MGFSNAAFWIFLASTVVASLTFVMVVVWVEARRKERQEYYRFEFRKRLAESGKINATAFGSLVQYENAVKLRQGREKLLIAGFIILGVGVGICAGFQFMSGSLWMLGLIPACMGFFMLLYGFMFAAKPSLEAPPLGWSPESQERD